MNPDDITPDNRQAVMTIAIGLITLALVLFLVTRVLKFKFVVGVGD